MQATKRKRPTPRRTSSSNIEDVANTPERRKLRNRMSQRAFRARQTMRIQELEERLEKATGPDILWTIELQDQNAQLREQLLQVYKKATSLQISMKALADTALHALGIDGSTISPQADANDTTADLNSQSPSPEQSIGVEIPQDTAFQAFPGTLEEIEEVPGPQSLGFAADTESSRYSTHNVSAGPSGGYAWEPQHLESSNTIAGDSRHRPNDSLIGSSSTSAPAKVADFLHNTSQVMSLVPRATDYLGLQHYYDLEERAVTICSDMPMLKRTNSAFSDHINAVEACLASQRAQRGLMVTADRSLVTLSSHMRSCAEIVGSLLAAIEFMINAFVNVSWTQMTGWETYTRTLTAVKDLTAWRMNRTMASWEKIVPQYRPTRIQISVSHPSVIDWIPWPSLRDKLIVHHSANPKLDEIVSDIGKLYVVQADLSTLVKCPHPVIGYVPVWPLVQACAAHDTSEAQYDPMGRCSSFDPSGIVSQRYLPSDLRLSQHFDYCEPTKLPAASANELFGTVSLAKAAHRLLHLDRGAAFNYRLDPAFFESHPELYDETANIIAYGVRLQSDSEFAHQPYPLPTSLDNSIISQYQNLSQLALDYVSV